MESMTLTNVLFEQVEISLAAGEEEVDGEEDVEGAVEIRTDLTTKGKRQNSTVIMKMMMVRV